jgi:hypothetical protein
MKPSFPTCLALALTAACAPSLQAQSLADRVTFSGFGTAAAVVTDDASSMYVREQEAKGASTSPSMLVDSNLGLKATAQIAPWLSATVQTLTAQQSSPHLVTRLDWAYLKATPSDDLTLRLGKLNIPNFMISDSRRIGYANIALRPANEVYGLDYLNGGLVGGEADYRLKVGGNDLTASVLAGTGTYHDVGVNTVRFHRIYGLNAVWDGGWYQVRVGHVETRDTDFGAFGQLLQQGVPAGTDISKDVYRFTGIGFSAEKDGVIVQAEGVQRSSRYFNDVIGARAWYALVGYRLDKVVPFVQVARRLPNTAQALSVFPQKTIAAGVRWDAFSKADVKFQLEHVDTFGRNGASFSYLGGTPARTVDTASVAVDFVF